MAQIEGKSQKIKGEIETIRNHVNLNLNKVKVASDDIERLRATIILIEAEQLECDSKLKQLGDDQQIKERDLQRFREQYNQMKSSQNELKNKNYILSSLMKA